MGYVASWWSSEREAVDATLRLPAQCGSELDSLGPVDDHKATVCTNEVTMFGHITGQCGTHKAILIEGVANIHFGKRLSNQITYGCQCTKAG